MNELRLQTILTVLPVLSAGLYLMGATYHQGYLDVFGLDDSLFPLATDKALLSGFLALVTFGLVPMLYSIFAGLALAFTVVSCRGTFLPSESKALAVRNPREVAKVAGQKSAIRRNESSRG